MQAPASVGGRPKVELRDVGLRYFGLEGETEALKDISLTVAPGEFVAIIGQSGCGKSTLLSLISGIIEPTEGAVLVDGMPVDRAEPQGRLHAAAGLPVRVAHHPGKRACSAPKSRAPTWRRRASARRSF